MTPAELATFILVFCTAPNGIEMNEKCVDHMVNCPYTKGATIDEKRVKECLLTRPSDWKKYEE